LTVHRWAEHTGELELEIEADSERAVFEESFMAMRELLDGEPRGPLSARHVVLRARDRPELLADWVGELAFIAEEALLPIRLTSLELDAAGLQATIDCAPAETPHLVKAATYHRLLLEGRGAVWRARVVLDV
jgi:SHS2 domain-containing protein